MSQSGAGDIEERIARLEEQDQRLTRALELLARREAAPAVNAGRNWDAYAAVIASFIGLLALAVSGYTAYVERQQLRAQVWPHVLLVYSSAEPRFWATNQGTGPARITAVRVIVNGAAVKTWGGMQKAAGFTDGEGVAEADLGGQVLSPGAEYVFAKPENEQSLAKFRELFPGGKHAVSVTVCYCSVLDECWVVSHHLPRDDGKPHPIDTCPIAAAERFTE